MAYVYSDDPADALAGEPTTESLLRSREIPWDIYMTARLISDRDLALLRRYDKRDPAQQARLLDDPEVRGGREEGEVPGEGGALGAELAQGTTG